MWQILCTVINVFVLQHIAAHMLISKPDLQVAYHVTLDRDCESDEHKFQMMFGQTLPDCVIECALREHCAVMNYQEAMTLCQLYKKEGQKVPNTSHRCKSVLKNNIRLIKSPCNDHKACPIGQACDILSKTCLFKECLDTPNVTNGHVLGNRNEVGSRIRFKCNRGYTLSEDSSATAVCDNGEWSNSGHCVSDMQYGDGCSTYIDAENCKMNNTDCIEGICRCAGGYYWNNTECVTKKELGAVCPSPSASGVSYTASCNDTNAECRPEDDVYKCRCSDNHYDNDGDDNEGGHCLIQKKQLGDTCQLIAACNDSNAECNGRCGCKVGFYDDTGTDDVGGTCTLKKQLGDTCQLIAACNDSNAECNGHCGCKVGFYDDTGTDDVGGTCTLKNELGAECPSPSASGVSHTDSCNDTQAECRQEVDVYKCRCSVNHYDNNGDDNEGGQCIQKVTLGGKCSSASEPCNDSNAECTNTNSGYKCQCKTGYYDYDDDDKTDNVGGTCEPMGAVGNKCNDVCLDDNATCVVYRKGEAIKYCHCNFGFEFNETVGACIKECNQYSNDFLDFNETSGKRLKNYGCGEQKKTDSFSDCVNLCSKTYPTFLSINFMPDKLQCVCKTISERQYTKAHGSLASSDSQNKHFYDRPCASKQAT